MKTISHAVQGNVKLDDLYAAIADYSIGTSPEFSEAAGWPFATHDGEQADPLIVSMSQFDAAMRQVREGSCDRFSIEWDRNPNAVFRALRVGAELPLSEGIACYFMEVSAKIPGLVCCTRFA